MRNRYIRRTPFFIAVQSRKKDVVAVPANVEFNHGADVATVGMQRINDRTDSSAEHGVHDLNQILPARICANGNKFGRRPNQKPTEEQVILTKRKRPRHPEQDQLKDCRWKFMNIQLLQGRGHPMSVMFLWSSLSSLEVSNLP